MSLFIASINSGSNGNCYYVGNREEAVLIDVGISCREVEKRMTRLGLSLQTVKAIFISHEHSDHIKGLEVFSRKHQIPVYITEKTLANSSLNLSQVEVNSFDAYTPIEIGNLSVLGFPKLHDAADPYSFTVTGNKVQIGVFTDIGSSCEHVIENFRSCDAVFLEANYDEHMLETGSYPYYLKQRIQGNSGHLSNKQALDLFIEHRSESLSHVLLSHLSKDNNSPELVYDLFSKHAGSCKIAVASRYEESAVYHVVKGMRFEKTVREIKTIVTNDQMTLF